MPLDLTEIETPTDATYCVMDRAGLNALPIGGYIEDCDGCRYEKTEDGYRRNDEDIAENTEVSVARYLPAILLNPEVLGKSYAFYEGDRVYCTYGFTWDGPATVVAFEGGLVFLKPDHKDVVGAFEPAYVIAALVEGKDAELEGAFVNDLAGLRALEAFAVIQLLDGLTPMAKGADDVWRTTNALSPDIETYDLTPSVEELVQKGGAVVIHAAG